MTIVPRKPQRANTTPQTRSKGKRLRVVELFRTFAYVEGDHDVYTVQFDRLTCDCEAGRARLHCSHVMAAIRERAIAHGRGNVTFGNSAKHAASWAELQRKKGYAPVVCNVGTWHWVEWAGTRSILSVGPVRPPVSFAEAQAAVDELF